MFYGVVLHDIADVHRARGELDEAARVYQQALEHKRRGSADPDDIAETARALGVAYGGLGRGGQEGAYAQALAAYREALELTGAEADPVFYGVVLHDIADVHRARGELDEAARVYQQALEHKRRGSADPDDIAETARALGVAYGGLGRGGQEGAYAQALAAYREALELTGAEADPVFYGVVLHDIADVHRARGELDEAARVYQQALEHKRRGDGSPRDRATTARALGVAYEGLGRGGQEGAYAQALAAYREALELTGAEADPVFYGVVLHDIADVHRARGELDEAARVYQQALEHKRRGSAARDIAAVLVRLAEVYRDLGRPDEALRGATEAVQVLKASPEVGPRARAEVLVFAARLQIQSDPGQAIPFLEEAAQLLGPEQAADPLERVTVLDLLAAAHRALGREAEAREAAAAADGILAGSAASFNISWPWNGDENDIASTADEIRNGRLYVVLNPGAKGLRFNRRLARFTEGPRYKDLDVGQRHQSPGSRRRDGRPLVISLPYLEGSIEKVTYVVNDDVLTLIVVPASPGVKFRPGDVEFFRELPLDYTALPDDLLAAAADEALAGKDAIRLLALGLALIEHQELERAGAAIERAKAVLQSRPPGEVPAMRSSLARALDYLGRAHEDNRAYAQALAAYREALELTGAEADPVFYGVVLHDIADVHRARGELDEAARVYQQALEHKRRGSAARDIAAVLVRLAEVYRDLGRPDEALRGATEAVQVLKASPEVGPRARAEVLVFAARLQIQSDPGQAIPFLEEAAQLLGPEQAADPLERVTVLDLLAAAHRALGREAEAREAAAAADGILAGSAASFNISWPWNGDENDIASTADEIRNGRLYVVLNPGAKGLRFNRRLARFTEGPRYKDLDVGQRHQSPGSRRRDGRPLVISLPYLEGSIEKVTYVVNDDVLTLIVVPASPGVKFRPGDVEFFRELPLDYTALPDDLLAAAADEALAGKDAIRLLALGLALIEHQELERAGAAIERAKAVLQSRPPGEVPAMRSSLARALDYLGRAHEDNRAYAQALAAYREALELTGAEADPVFYGVVLHDIADVHRARGELDEAARVYQQALEHKRRGSAARDIAAVLVRLAEVYRDLGRPDEALRGATEAVQVLKASPEVGPRARAEVLVFAARLQAQDAPGQAVLLLEEAEQLVALERAGEPAERIAMLKLLAETYMTLGRDDKAQDAARKVIGPIRELLANELRILGTDHPDTLVTRGHLALWTGKSGDSKGALHLFSELLKDRLRILGPEHPATLLTRGNLALWTAKAGDKVSAARIFNELLNDRLRLMGDSYLKAAAGTFTAFWTGESGDAVGVVRWLNDLLVEFEQALGNDHASIGLVRSMLAQFTQPS